MTTATREVIERVRRLSPRELDELAAWLARYRDRASASAPLPRPPVPRPDFAARLRAGWGDAPPAAENTVVALREEERA